MIQTLVLVHRTLQLFFALFETETSTDIRRLLFVLVVPVLSLLVLFILLLVLFALLGARVRWKLDKVGILSQGSAPKQIAMSGLTDHIQRPLIVIL
jgi:hypothetical protein